MFSYKLCYCERWSIIAPAFMYLTFAWLVWFFPLPLKSSLNSVELLTKVFATDMPDHFEGVRIERDGEINKEFHKEVLLGEGEFERRKEENPKELLEDIFVRADTNSDEYLTKEELSIWISAKIQQHINQALADNYILFASVDVNPKNGLVSWEEYHHYYLNHRGLTKGNKETPEKVYASLDRKTKESIMRDKAAWSEASRFNPEQLTVDEFLAFRHPESSHATILTLVEELFNKFDRDGDDLLTEDEFAVLQTFSNNEVETKDRGEEERRIEFRSEIDRNKDGKADRHELLMYIDPKNPRHAREEAQSLISVADFNEDGKLSLSEVLNKIDLFLGSKMVDTAKSFHDEF